MRPGVIDHYAAALSDDKNELQENEVIQGITGKHSNATGTNICLEA